jgi:hypothetical protein
LVLEALEPLTVVRLGEQMAVTLYFLPLLLLAVAEEQEIMVNGKLVALVALAVARAERLEL